jgi:hypothetical protein
MYPHVGLSEGRGHILDNSSTNSDLPFFRPDHINCF